MGITILKSVNLKHIYQRFYLLLMSISSENGNNKKNESGSDLMVADIHKHRKAIKKIIIFKEKKSRYPIHKIVS